MQKALNSALQTPPSVYSFTNTQGKEIGEPVGIPIYIVLDLLINTGAGYDLFRSNEFNVAVKKFLDDWGKYLSTDPTSNSTLDTSATGWFGVHGLSVLQQGLKGLSFAHTYGVEPKEAQKYYATWDAFFIRQIKDIDQLRPIEVPDLYPALYNACESTSLRTVHGVKLDDTFWLKTQNYSLYDMLGGNVNTVTSAYAERFVGGSVYQAFLSPQDYHRFHSPISGKVLEAAVVPGTYYAALPDDGAPAGDPHLEEGDPHGALMRSQPWLSISAARGVIILEPDNPVLPVELVAFIPIGMVEVSTVDLCVSKEGTGGKPNTVKIGDPLGMFHFGGSSYALIVKPKAGYVVEFKDFNDEYIKPNQHRWVRSIIGRVVKPEN